MAYAPPMPNPSTFVDVAKSAGLHVDDTALNEIREILAAGDRKLVPKAGDLDLIEFHQAFRILTSAAITAAAADHVNFIGAAHIRKGLKWICPLFPFC